MGNWYVFSSRGFILDFGLGAGLPFHFKWQVREMNGNSHDLSPPLHHFHTVIIVATFPVFIKYPVKGLRCHPNYQAGMGFTL